MSERLWCTACGTVTRDAICDCNRWTTDTQRKPHFVNYADAMQETAHEQAQQIEMLRKALQEIADLPPVNMATRPVQKQTRDIAIKALRSITEIGT